MNSEAYLCDICSEIYRFEEELRAHMLEDHNTQYFLLEDKSVDTTEDTGTTEVIVPDIHDIDINAMMEVTDEIDFRPLTSSGEPLPTTELCIDIPVNVAEVAPQGSEGNKKSSSLPEPKKRKRRGGRQSGEIHSCEFCSYKTKIKSCMTTHRLTHTLDCPFCQYKTIIPDRLNQHLNIKHFNNNGIERVDHQSKKTFLLPRKDYMMDDFIFAEEVITVPDTDRVATDDDKKEDSQDNVSELSDNVATKEKEQSEKYRYLNPSVIIASDDIQKVNQAYEYICKRGYVG